MTKIITTDKTIASDETVTFVLQCIAQIGQFPGVDDGLRRRGLTAAANAAVEAVGRSSASEPSSVEMPEVDRATLAALCGSVIETLEEYRDLGPVLGINAEQAEKLLNSI